MTVDLGITGTATAGDDYNASGNQIVIVAGATSGSITVTAVDDAIDDDAETVIVDVTGVTGPANEDGEQQATTTITDDDDPAVEPGNRITIAKDLTAAPGEAITVPVNIQLLDQPAGQELLGFTVAITFDADVLTLDTVDAGNFVTGRGWTLVPNPGAGQVVLVGFTTTATDGPLTEVLANLNFTVAAGAPAGPTALNIVDGIGPARTELLDASDGVIPLADPATAAGDDRADGVITIVGDAGPTVSLAVDAANIAENGGVATVTATLSETVTADVTVDLGIAGTATAGDDYNASGNQIVIAAGATSGAIMVTAVDDAIDDDAETVIVDITGVAGAAENGEQQVTITIDDDDDPVVLPTVTLAVDNADIAEDGGVATFTATLSAASTADVTVDLGITGTATAGDDYNASGNQIVIAAGATSGSITVTAVDDAIDDDAETVIVDITGVTGATEDGEQQATTTITDDDDPVVPTVALSVDNTEISEAGGVATFIATLSGAATSDVTVDLGITGTAANGADYNASGMQIVIPTGSTSGSITVTAVDDDTDEPDETVVVDITNVTGATGSGVAITTIIDNDEAGPSVSLSVDNLAIPEAAGVANVTATLSVVQTADVVVDLGVTGTATTGTDYTISATQLTIPAGSTTAAATVTAVQDTDVEVNESIIVDIVAVTGAVEAGVQQVTITIGDDDGVNDPPDLENPGTQNTAETADTLDVTLIATDPNVGDTLTFSAVIEGGELALDQTLGLNFTGDFFTNFSEGDSGGRVALNEKWLLADDGRTWYYIEPNGDLYRWLGGGVLNREFVATVSTEAYDNPALLYDAQPGGVTVPVTATITGNVLTLDPAPGFVGAFTVVATVSDGERTDTETFLVTVAPNEAPTLVSPGDQSLPTTQDTLDVALTATDPMNDPITFAAEVTTAEFYLDQTIGFQLGPNGTERNWSESQDEQWVLADNGNTWYFILPDGSLHRWLGGDKDIIPNSEPVAQLSPDTHADPSLLYDAQPTAGTPVANVSINGSTLTIDPNAGFVGTFGVLLTATDSGGLSDSELIRVDVTAAPAGKIQIPLNLAGRAEPGQAGAADTALAEGEMGFVDSGYGLAESGEPFADGSQDADRALDQLLEDDLLADLEEFISDLM